MMSHSFASVTLLIISCTIVASVFGATKNQILVDELAKKNIAEIPKAIFPDEHLKTVNDCFNNLVHIAKGYSPFQPDKAQLDKIGVTMFCYMAYKLHPRGDEVLPIQFFGPFAEGINLPLKFEENLEATKLLPINKIVNSTFQGAFKTVEFLANEVPSIKKGSIKLNSASYYYDESVWSVKDGEFAGDYLPFAVALKATDGAGGVAGALQRGKSFVGNLARGIRKSVSGDDESEGKKDLNTSAGTIDLVLLNGMMASSM